VRTSPSGQRSIVDHIDVVQDDGSFEAREISNRKKIAVFQPPPVAAIPFGARFQPHAEGVIGLQEFQNHVRKVMDLMSTSADPNQASGECDVTLACACDVHRLGAIVDVSGPKNECQAAARSSLHSACFSQSTDAAARVHSVPSAQSLASDSASKTERLWPPAAAKMDTIRCCSHAVVLVDELHSTSEGRWRREGMVATLSCWFEVG